ncbi:MAG: ATP-binding protein [Alphaproteobacteria bacterium]
MSDIALGSSHSKSTASVSSVPEASEPAPQTVAQKPEVVEEQTVVREVVHQVIIEDNVSNDYFSPKEKYEYLSEYGTQILAMLSAQSGCTYLSKNFEALTGNLPEDCVNQGFYNILQKDYHERLNDLLELVTHENKSHTLHCKLKHGNDEFQWYSLTIHPAKQKDAGNCVCILENIHESVQAQSTLQKAKMEAELALGARSEFLNNMSHDLRTPLNAVIGFAQIIETQMFGQVNPQYLEYAKHIQESGYDLLAKVEDLLEVANIDSGRIQLDKSDTNLSELLKHAIASQAHHAANSDIFIEYAPPSCGDILLHVDRTKFQHIIGHLLANAIKFSHRGSKVTIEADIDEQNHFILRVCDHGIGINASKLEGIVNALQQSNCWSIGNTGNVGLGLALTREFVALHGGEISIHSEVGDGTTVELRLPEDCLRMPVNRLPFYAVAG